MVARGWIKHWLSKIKHWLNKMHDRFGEMVERNIANKVYSIYAMVGGNA
jgi:hypothetical protein